MARYNEKYFNVGNDMSANKVEDILDDGEAILLRTKPKKSAYLWSKILEMMPMVLIWLAIVTYAIVFSVHTISDADVQPIFIVTIAVSFAFLLIPVWMWLYRIITGAIRYKNIEYVFTEKRVIIRSGLIGIDFTSIYYSDIEGVNLNVGFIDRILKVGDIYIKAKTQSCSLVDIQNPYKLLSAIQKITLDIKTDIMYPNDLRPAENHGFNTKYVKDDKSSSEKTKSDSENSKNNKNKKEE